MPRDRVLFALMLRTGLRLGSALGLDVEDMDLERGELLLRTMKNATQDVVVLPRVVRDDLRAWLGERASGPLFESYPGRRLGGRSARRRFELVLQAAGIDRVRGTHCLRHTLGMRVYERSGDIALTQAALHHRSIASTLVYARAEEAKLRRVLGG